MLDLTQKILEMTQDTEAKTVEWIFNAIDKVLAVDIHEKIHEIMLEKFGSTPKRDNNYVYARDRIRNQVIDELIGANIYSAGMYYVQRGYNRNRKPEKIINDVKKDYDTKRKSLETKVIKLAGDNAIINLSNVTVESDGKLGCTAILDNNDRIEIYAIPAGGWNIQKFHFRGLAKRIKAK